MARSYSKFSDNVWHQIEHDADTAIEYMQKALAMPSASRDKLVLCLLKGVKGRPQFQVEMENAINEVISYEFENGEDGPMTKEIEGIDMDLLRRIEGFAGGIPAHLKKQAD